TDTESPKGWTQWQPSTSFSGTDLMTYDVVRRNILYFTPQTDDAGNSIASQTWVWDAGTAAWIQKAPLTNPKLSSAALAFDEARGTAVLFGGVFYNQRPNGIGGL